MSVPAAATYQLIECERGLGRMLPRACARRYQIGNAAPGSLGATRAMDAASVRNSPCRGCEHGKARVKAGAAEQDAPLVKLGDLALVSPASLRGLTAKTEERRRVTAPQMKPPPAAATCKVCVGPAPLGAANHQRATCSDACRHEWSLRQARATYYRRQGRPDAAEAALRGESPPRAKASPTLAVAKGEPLPTAAATPAQASSDGSAAPSDTSHADPPRADHSGATPVDERRVAPAAATAEPAAIGPYAYVVRVHGLPVKCRTLDDVIALVRQYGEQKGKAPGAA